MFSNMVPCVVHLCFVGVAVQFSDMKPPKFWPIQKHERTPEIVAKDISPETFQTIWGSQFTDYENGLRKKIKAQEKRREIKQARIEHLQTLRNRGLTLQEIGDLVGITRERVR